MKNIWQLSFLQKFFFSRSCCCCCFDGNGDDDDDDGGDDMRAAKVEERKKTKAKSVGQEGLLGERQSALPEWNTMELEMSGTRCLITLISINFTKKLLSKKDIISLAKLKTKIRRKFANHESKLGFYNRTNLPLSHYFYFLYTISPYFLTTLKHLFLSVKDRVTA